MSQMKELNHLKIPLQAIKNCTQDFNETNFIGKGGYGRVYKGILFWNDYQNLPVAVKQLDVTGFQGSKEFYTEVLMLSQYQHKNIVTLIGFCDDGDEMILVYEYASHGSLDTYLSDPSKLGLLSWEKRINICVGAASALDYLHNHVSTNHRIIHRDIKSANILLDENWNAKLSDFGLSKICLANQQNTFVVTNLAGTHGYCDPQYERTGILTKESDIYSFGMVLFEVLCGRLACVLKYHDERRFLHHLARTCYKNGEVDKIIDERMRENIMAEPLNMFSAIAYQCLHKTRELRPTIAEVALTLENVSRIQIGAPVMKTSNHSLPPPPILPTIWDSTLNDNLLNSGVWAPPPQESARMRTHIKVYKRGTVGRSINISGYSGYEELKQDLARIFGIEGELEDRETAGWTLVYMDRENDVLMVGDDPWEEFVSYVWCIKIMSPQEVQQMSLDADFGGNNGVLMDQACSSSDGGNV